MKTPGSPLNARPPPSELERGVGSIFVRFQS